MYSCVCKHGEMRLKSVDSQRCECHIIGGRDGQRGRVLLLSGCHKENQPEGRATIVVLRSIISNRK